MHRIRSVLIPFLAAVELAVAQGTTFNLVDQHGSAIQGTRFSLDGGPLFAAGAPFATTAGSHVLSIYPGLNNQVQAGGLLRTEAITLTEGQALLEIEWQTTAVSLVLRDQHGVAIPGSTGTFVDVPGLGYQSLPLTLVLPITDSAVYPTIAGSASEGSEKGYDVQVIPGIAGSPQSFIQMLRTPGAASSSDAVTVHADTTEVAIVWMTREVTLHLRDQFGIDIPGSRAILDAIPGTMVLPASLSLPVNDLATYPDMTGSESGATSGGFGYGLNLMPGILGEFAGGHLQRLEGRNAGHEVIVESDTNELAFEWITTTLAIDIKDQHGASILGSEVLLYAAPGSGYHVTPFSCTLPISDVAVYPTMDGPAREGVDLGYDVLLLPGIEGLRQRDTAPVYQVVWRWAGQNPQLDEPVAVHAGQDHLDFQWVTADLVVAVKDQNGADIPGSTVQLPSLSPDRRSAPFSITLPVSDPALYPSIGGPAAEGLAKGYDAIVEPGLDGQSQSPCCSGGLFRYFGTETIPGSEQVEVHPGQSALHFSWQVVSCGLQLISAGGVPQQAAVMTLPSPMLPRAPGTAIVLPITDNDVHSNIQGAFANGYPILIDPDGTGAVNGMFEFEVTASGALVPGSFNIAGMNYSLACGFNRAPIADAGDNVFVQSAAVAGTTVLGSATDPDGDAMQYRWLEGPLVLFGWASVTATGNANLPLAGLGLQPGTHNLSLEVSDGLQVSAAAMVLTIGNSPPVAVASGGGTYQAGVGTVSLSGTVADYDGDAIAWSWRRGSAIIASGVVATSVGGDPTALPSVALTTGSSGVLPVGSHLLTLQVADGHNPAEEREVTVTVIDTMAPVLCPRIDCGVLWPPNHRMVTVVIHANVVDQGGGPVVLSATVQSSEDCDKNGDGHTVPDWTTPVIDQATGTITLQLRAERSGRGSGRRYTIIVRAVDAAGNTATASVHCSAPHSRR